MEQVYLTAIETLSQLTRETDAGGFYRQMEISTCEMHRLYITCCPFGHDGLYLLHNEFDVCSAMDDTFVMDKNKTISYIRSLRTIEFIGIYLPENDKTEDITVKYKEFS